MAAILYFCLNFISHCIAGRATELSDIENMGISLEISLLCSIEPEITRDKRNIKKTGFEALGRKIIVGEG